MTRLGRTAGGGALPVVRQEVLQRGEEVARREPVRDAALEVEPVDEVAEPAESHVGREVQQAAHERQEPRMVREEAEEAAEVEDTALVGLAAELEHRAVVVVAVEAIEVPIEEAV